MRYPYNGQAVVSMGVLYCFEMTSILLFFKGRRAMLFCPIGRILLFGLAQKVNTKKAFLSSRLRPLRPEKLRTEN